MFNNRHTNLQIYTNVRIRDEATTKQRLNRGQLLIEALISISLVSTVLLAIVPLFSVALLGSKTSYSSIDATNLARECQESARVIAKQDYNNIYKPLGTTNKGPANLYHPEIQGSSWVLQASAQNILQNGTTYQRSLYIENVQRDQNGLGNIVASGGTEDKSTQKVTCEVSYPQGPLISNYTFISRNRNLLYSQTSWSGGPGVDYLSDDGNIDISQSGQIFLKQTGSANQMYGNQFISQSVGTLGALDSSSKKSSFRFSVPSNLSVSALQIYIQTASNTNRVTYRVGIQGDSGAGLPNGSFISSNTLSNALTLWNRIPLSPSANLSAGQVYHLVVEYASGTISNRNYINLRNSDPRNAFRPKDSTAEMSYNTIFFDGTAWQIQNQQPIFLLEDTTSSVLGDPYHATGNMGIYGAFQYGQVFTVSGGDKTAQGVRFYLRKNTSQNPADSLYFTIFDLTDNSEVLTDIFSFGIGGQASTAYAWYTHEFISNLSLLDGHTYRVSLKSPGSNAQRNYQLLNIATINDPKFIDQTFEGQNSKFTQSTDSGANFTDSNTSDTNFIFDFLGGGGGAFASHGELISNTFDSGKESAYNTVSYLGNPNSQTIKIQLATNNDNSTWNFVGPDCTAGTFYQAQFEKISCNNSFNQRYLRYKIILESNGSSSPIFEEIRINYSP